MSTTSQPAKTITGITVIREFPTNIIFGIGYVYTESKEPNTFEKLEEMIEKCSDQLKKDYFLINFEKETRYNPNGSLATEPEDGSNCYIVAFQYGEDYAVYATSCRDKDHKKFALKTERLFDDEEKAENWTKILNSNLEIKEKIKEINLENGYTGFENGKPNYYWQILDGVIDHSISSIREYQSTTFMCGNANEWMNENLTKEQITNFIKYS